MHVGITLRKSLILSKKNQSKLNLAQEFEEGKMYIWLRVVRESLPRNISDIVDLKHFANSIPRNE